ncbi:tetratricopeptide repeat protein [soil metagenome]
MPADPAPSARFFPIPYSLFPLLLLIALLTFSPTLFNNYAYDSNIYLERLGNNPAATPRILFGSPSEYSEITGVMSWRPVTLFQFMILDLGLFGKNPFLSHLLDIIIHAANAWLLFRLLIFLRPQSAHAALLAVIFFLVHPLTSEVVLCMGFRFDSLAVFFGMLAAYVSTLKNSRAAIPYSPFPPFILLPSSFILFFLALGSKESGIFAIFLIPAIHYLNFRNKSTAVIKTIPYTLYPIPIVILFALLWKHYQYAKYPAEFMGGGGRILGIGNFAVVFWTIYFPRLFFPWTLRIDHEFTPYTELNIQIASAVVGLLVLIGATAWLARRNSWAQIGLLLVLVGFLPVAQLTAIPDPVAERFCYLPMLGFAALFGALFPGNVISPDWRFSTSPQPSARSSFIHPFPIPHSLLPLLLLLLALRTHLRAYDWRDDTTLNIRNWEASSPPSDRALESLGALYLTRATATAQREGIPVTQTPDYPKSRATLDTFLTRHPDDPEAKRLLGVWEQIGAADRK